MSVEKCLICGHVIAEVNFPGSALGRFDCPVCGAYSASEELAEDGIDPHMVPSTTRYMLQAWVKRRPIQGLPMPVLTNQTCADAIREVPHYVPADKMDQLLLAYAALCERPGRSCAQDSNLDYPYAFAAAWDECHVYQRWLGHGGFVEGSGTGITLTRAGWERAGQLQSIRPSSEKSTFVAMWFEDQMDDAWNHGIAPAISDTGFQPRRVKGESHPDRIDARVVAGIRTCKFLVADVTGARPAVYYEAGLGEGLGKSVIWCCRHDWENQLCFDTRQFQHVLWETPGDLRVKLRDTILARIPGLARQP